MNTDVNGINIRMVTALDKENILSIRDNAEAFPDTLPALFDYYSAIPNAYLAGVFYEEKLAGFIVGHIVDGGNTCVLRCGRAAPEFEGRGLIRQLCRHLGKLAINTGVQTILSLAGEVPATSWSEKSGVSVRIVHSWRWTEVTFTPGRQISEENGETGNLENISDEVLSTIFNDKTTRDYIAPKGVIMIHWTPLKPMAENIPTIRGVDGSTHIYSDIKPGSDGCTGLLTCCTKYKAAPGSMTDFKLSLDMFGSDLSSLRKHVAKHLNDIMKAAESAVGLELYPPEGIEWGDVIAIFNEFGISLGKDIAFDNTYALELWRSANVAHR